MNLPTVEFRFTFLTHCFSGTADGKDAKSAEMRVPPIRGHIRFWHRAHYGQNSTIGVWGSAAGNEGLGSRVALRLIGEPIKSSQAAPMLPHKAEREQGKRPALQPGRQAEFVLHVQRLVGCSEVGWQAAQRAVQLWLLAGGLGLRSNRAAGSVWPLPSPAWPQPPQTSAALKAELQRLGFTWPVSLAGQASGLSADQLRATASDTIKGNPHRRIFGGINPRDPSPTKMKVILLDTGFCLLITAPERDLLRQAENLLNGRGQNAKPNPARWTSLGAWQQILP